MLSSDTISRYKSLDFFARQVVEGFITGRHRSPFHGFSVEFSDYRQYNTGESTRNIDWRLFGRTDRLYIKQFEEETNLRCQLVIDHSGSMLFPLEGQGEIEHPNKLTFSVYAAAVLIELLHRQRDAFGLTLISDRIDTNTPCRSNTAHQQYLYTELEKLLQPSTTHAIKQSSTQALKHSSNQSLKQSLHLLAEQLHALELQLGYDARPYRFIDLESGDTINLNPSEIAATYRSMMEHQQAELQQRALQYRIDYIPVDIAQGFHQILLPFLLKRSKQ